MKKVLMSVIFLFAFISSTTNAGGDKVNNPLNAATWDDGCVLVFDDGIEKDLQTLKTSIAKKDEEATTV